MKTQTASIQRRHSHLQLPLLCLLGLMALQDLTFAGSDHAADPGIVPVNARFRGLTYGEWVVQWNQWYYDTVLLPNSPFWDTTGGDYFAVGQSGPVWFLPWTGMFVVDRSITVPAGSAFLAVPHAIDALFQLPPDATHEQIAAVGQAMFDFTAAHYINLVFEVDGVEVQDPSRYQVVSPRFDVDLPGGSLNWWNKDAGVYGPDIAEGFFYLVKPLSVGQHTIHWSLDVVDNPPINGHWQATYHVTVVPRSGE